MIIIIKETSAGHVNKLEMVVPQKFSGCAEEESGAGRERTFSLKGGSYEAYLLGKNLHSPCLVCAYGY